MVSFRIFRFHGRTSEIGEIHRDKWPGSDMSNDIIVGKPLFQWCLIYIYIIYIYLVGGLEHEFYFSVQLGIIIPTDEHIFQRGWSHQSDIYIYIYMCLSQVMYRNPEIERLETLKLWRRHHLRGLLYPDTTFFHGSPHAQWLILDDFRKARNNISFPDSESTRDSSIIVTIYLWTIDVYSDLLY